MPHSEQRQHRAAINRHLQLETEALRRRVAVERAAEERPDHPSQRNMKRCERLQLAHRSPKITPRRIVFPRECRES